jgi:hypothetical protein
MIEKQVSHQEHPLNVLREVRNQLPLQISGLMTCGNREVSDGTQEVHVTIRSISGLIEMLREHVHRKDGPAPLSPEKVVPLGGTKTYPVRN